MMNNQEWMIEDDKLEEAVGGNVTLGNRIFSGLVDGVDAIPGQDYFILLKDGRNWYYGTLLENTDRDIFGKCERRLKFQVHVINGDHTEVPNTYKVSQVALYKNCFTSEHGSF